MATANLVNNILQESKNGKTATINEATLQRLSTPIVLVARLYGGFPSVYELECCPCDGGSNARCLWTHKVAWTQVSEMQ